MSQVYDDVALWHLFLALFITSVLRWRMTVSQSHQDIPATNKNKTLVLNIALGFNANTVEQCYISPSLSPALVCLGVIFVRKRPVRKDS